MQINRAGLRVVIKKGMRKYSTQIQMWGWAALGPSCFVPSVAIPSQAGMLGGSSLWPHNPLVKMVGIWGESGSARGLQCLPNGRLYM